MENIRESISPLEGGFLEREVVETSFLSFSEMQAG